MTKTKAAGSRNRYERRMANVDDGGKPLHDCNVRGMWFRGTAWQNGDESGTCPPCSRNGPAAAIAYLLGCGLPETPEASCICLRWRRT